MLGMLVVPCIGGCITAPMNANLMVSKLQRATSKSNPNTNLATGSTASVSGTTNGASPSSSPSGSVQLTAAVVSPAASPSSSPPSSPPSLVKLHQSQPKLTSIVSGIELAEAQPNKERKPITYIKEEPHSATTGGRASASNGRRSTVSRPSLMIPNTNAIATIIEYKKLIKKLKYYKYSWIILGSLTSAIILAGIIDENLICFSFVFGMILCNGLAHFADRFYLIW